MALQGKIRLAILSPSGSAYSETFIRAQRDLLPFDVYYYFGGLVPNKLDYGNKLRKLKVSLVIWLWHRLLRLIRTTDYTLSEFLLRRSLLRNRIRVVLAQYGPVGEAVSKICSIEKICLIVHFHGYDAWVKEIFVKNGYYRNCFSVASRIIAVSTSMKKHLLDIGCPEDKLRYLVYGPADQFFQCRPSTTSRNFLAVGRFVDKKAPYYTILAFAKVLEMFPDARLYMAGDGPLLNMCINLVRYLKIDHAVIMLGVLSPAELASRFEDTLAFVQHSVKAINGDREGTPVVILEAAAAGLPIISTCHEGVLDLFVSNENALLVEEHDIDGMAGAMTLLLLNPDLAASIGSRARELIRNRSTLDSYIRSLSTLVRESI